MIFSTFIENSLCEEVSKNQIIINDCISDLEYLKNSIDKVDDNIESYESLNSIVSKVIKNLDSIRDNINIGKQ